MTFGDRGKFFVDVILQLRLGEIACGDAQQVAAESFGNDDRSIIAATVHRIHRLVFVDELPAELRVLVQFRHDLVTGVDLTGLARAGTAIEVDHGHIDVAGVLIRVPEADDVEPGIQRWSDDDPDDDDPCLGHTQDAPRIAREHTPDVSHERFLVGLKSGVCERPRRRSSLVHHVLSSAGCEGMLHSLSADMTRREQTTRIPWQLRKNGE